jgi:hypothetical protein
MTPRLRKIIAQSRPIFDPKLENLVAKEAVKDQTIKRCRISDHVHMVLMYLYEIEYWTEEEVCFFETPYAKRKGPKLRVIREHENRPALAPDGTVMTIHDEAFPGDTDMEPGEWDFKNVIRCKGYNI